MNNNIYTTFKFYDEKGRRLGIFGEYFPDSNVIEVAVFACSKKDFFSKKVARKAFELLCSGVNECNDEGFHPQLSIVDVYDDKPRKAFITWCQENFFKKFTITDKVVRSFEIIKNKDRTILKKDLGYSLANKMDYYL